MIPIILASASPRRKELFSRITSSFEVFPADCDESLPEKILPEEAVQLLACRKADCVAKQFPQAAVVGADTIVVSDGLILGKPKDHLQAKNMLRRLSGTTHRVLTGVCVLCKNQMESFVAETAVEFYPLTDEEILQYIRTGEPMDKAGAYGIQGVGSLFVRRIEGDYYNVVGLPVAKTARLLFQMGVTHSLIAKSTNE